MIKYCKSKYNFNIIYDIDNFYGFVKLPVEPLSVNDVKNSINLISQLKLKKII